VIDTKAVLVAELDRLAPRDEVPPPDWASLARHAVGAPRRRLFILVAAAALLLVAVATATVLATRDGASPRSRSKVYNGPLTVNANGAIAALDGRGRVRPVWGCPREHGCGILNGVAWSRDGTWLAYERPQWGRHRSGEGLYVVDLATRREWHVPPDQVGCNIASDLEWSPDGSRIAYACPNRIFVFNRRLTQRREVWGGPGAGHLSSPTWSAEGRFLAFATRIGDLQTGRSSVYVLNLAAGTTRLLTAHATAPAWSPDGRLIAVRASCGGIELLTPQGVNLTPSPGSVSCPAMGVPGIPVWSPDGQKLAIQMRPRGGVYVIDRDGRHLRSVAKRGSPGDTGGGAFGGDRPAWRPTQKVETSRAPGSSSDL
jgi:dipeptidyl aminopeptidase/acylaminoacyl peptidase